METRQENWPVVFEAKVIKIVAVKGENNDWAAYFGRPNQTDEEVAAWGLKISQATAEELFPGFVNAGLSYRWP